MSRISYDGKNQLQSKHHLSLILFIYRSLLIRTTSRVFFFFFFFGGGVGVEREDSLQWYIFSLPTYVCHTMQAILPLAVICPGFTSTLLSLFINTIFYLFSQNIRASSRIRPLPRDPLGKRLQNYNSATGFTINK